MGTIDIGPDGEPTRFKPGFLETEEMMRAGHEDFVRQMGPGYPNVGLDDSYEDGMGGSESSLDGLAMSFRDLTGREAYRQVAVGDGAVASGLWWVATGKTPFDDLEEEDGGGDMDEGRELTDRGADLGRFEEEAGGLLC